MKDFKIMLMLSVVHEVLCRKEANQKKKHSTEHEETAFHSVLKEYSLIKNKVSGKNILILDVLYLRH